MEQLWDTDIELDAVMKEVEIKFGEISNWEKGAFLPLDMSPHDDITLLCGDVPLLSGSMGRKGNKVVIRIKGKAEKNG